MTTTHAMPLGNFSVSLAVKDFEASRAFYLIMMVVDPDGNPILFDQHV